MKTNLDCIPCFLSQALRAGRKATNDERVLKKLLDTVGERLRNQSLDQSPPEIGRMVYQTVREVTGVTDPFYDVKQDCTERALRLYPKLSELVERAEDPLLTAIRIAIAGNVIDFGPRVDVDIEADVMQVMEKPMAVCDDAPFRSRLASSQRILYIGDNAGETVFDRLLIERLDRPVEYAVRSAPVINDATAADARAAGLDEVATIIESGTDAPGAVLNTCSAEFRERLAGADMIIAKGQGNYEALSDLDGPIFFLLMAKCELIARDLGVRKGDVVLRGARNNSR